MYKNYYDLFFCIAKFPRADRDVLNVPKFVKLPYPFLAGNIKTIIHYLGANPVDFTTDMCIERAMLIAGSFARQMCGLQAKHPTKAASTFNSKTLGLLTVKERNVPCAMFENNHVTVEQVCE